MNNLKDNEENENPVVVVENNQKIESYNNDKNLTISNNFEISNSNHDKDISQFNLVEVENDELIYISNDEFEFSLKQIPLYKFEICVGKKLDANEDAAPILQVKNNNKTGLLAVFDGMGGAGSTFYQNNQGDSRTGAYFASRLVRDFVNEDYKNLYNYKKFNQYILDLEIGLEKHLKNSLMELKSSGSRIKSKFSKELPTTLASIYYNIQDEGYCEIHTVWAGDSRVYLLHPSDGLQQLSKDDAKTIEILDTYLSTNQDAPLSKFVCANTKISLNYQMDSVKYPVILLVATDGCYAYVDSPIHFEKLILKSLLNSADNKQWKNSISHYLEKISSDDFSMSLVCIGWDSFSDIQIAFKERLEQINYLINPMNDISEKINYIDINIKNSEYEKQEKIKKIDNKLNELEEEAYHLYLKIDAENKKNENTKNNTISIFKSNFLEEFKGWFSKYIDRCMKNILNHFEEDSRKSALKIESYQKEIDINQVKIDGIKSMKKSTVQELDSKIYADKQKKEEYLCSKMEQSRSIWASYGKGYMSKMKREQ